MAHGLIIITNTALVQANIQQKHSIVDHLVPLGVIIEESGLQGEMLYCSFVNFKNALTMYLGVSFGKEW